MAGDKQTSKSRAGEEPQIPPGLIAQAQAIASSSPEPTSSGNNSSSSQNRPHGGSQGLGTNISNLLGPQMNETPIENAPPPAYSESYGLVDMAQDGLNTRARVANDGRVDINIDQTTSRISNLLVPALRNQLKVQEEEVPSTHPPAYIPPSLGGVPGKIPPPPPMNVVIHVVGSRGDVQPFVALGQVIKKTYGHRVRLATHPTFREFVQEHDLEFFSIGGDPAELMAFMVKNPGLMPGKDALKSGDIGRRRKGMYDIIRGCWRSCYEAGDGTGVAVSDDQPIENFDMSNKPFVADVIIANPPSFAHVHCAEKLGIPLHLMFTMPWSPTQSFPHPLANVQSSNADTSMTNFITYVLVEMMTWQGLGDIINRFRENMLGLEPISMMSAPGMIIRQKIPYTYCWSPALIPKPKDWGSHISISGFYFLKHASNYQPPPDLKEFLDSGPPPVYIGFGSIVVEDPNAMTKLIFDAVKKTGQRALVSKGWGGFGADAMGVPEGVFMLGNVPHDWLFNHVSCVVHHGGAGTTAAGIAMSKPTVIVPFFGDQPFWGAMVAKAGAGPTPIPNKKLNADNLAAAITEALKPETLERAKELGAKIATEKGTDEGAYTFHKTLDVDRLRCSLAPSRVAIWRVKRTEIRLSGFAAAVLGNEGLLDFNELKLYRPQEYDNDDGPWDPITGAAGALVGTIGSFMMGFADVPMEIFKSTRKSTDGSKNAAGGKKPAPGENKQDTASVKEGRTSSDGNSLKAPSTLDDGSSVHQSVGGESGKDQTASITDQSTQSGPSDPPKSPGLQPGKASDTERKRTPSPARDITMGTAIGAGKGFGRMVDAGLKSPMDFTLSLARGFHNAPKLYGDKSVRPSERITGFQSGLRAAGKEFSYGLYDGISGLVTQPLEGAKKEGFSGLVKGFGKGIGGVVFKPGAAFWGIPGYTFKGVYKELQKYFGSSVQNYIIAARTAQGYEDWKSSTAEERRDIISRWHEAQVELARQKKQWYSHRSRSKSQDRKQDKKSKTTPDAGALREQLPAGVVPQCLATSSNEAEFEQAIMDSIRATSTGNTEEDAAIERAIRVSVAELRRRPPGQDESEQSAIERAIKASIAEHSKGRDLDGGAKHDEHLEAAIQSSMRDNERGRGYNPDDSDIGTDDDENVKRAIEESKAHAQGHGGDGLEDDPELQRALKESEKHQQSRESENNRAKREEEIVLEYIKKQSLLEEEHRGRMG